MRLISGFNVCVVIMEEGATNGTVVNSGVRNSNYCGSGHMLLVVK